METNPATSPSLLPSNLFFLPPPDGCDIQRDPGHFHNLSGEVGRAVLIFPSLESKVQEMRPNCLNMEKNGGGLF